MQKITKNPKPFFTPLTYKLSELVYYETLTSKALHGKKPSIFIIRDSNCSQLHVGI